MQIPLRNFLARVVASFAVLFLAAPLANAQIVWNVTYADGNIRPSGTGFADPTVSGSTTIGQLRRDSVTAATNYLGSVLDGRGTVNLKFNSSQSDGTGFLAFYGPLWYQQDGSFQNGLAFQGARTNSFPSDQHGSGQFDFGFGWNYAGQTPDPAKYDMVSVAIHEVTHGLGFLSFLESNGQGSNGSTLGTPDGYSGFDKYVQRGTGTGGSIINTDINSANFGSFTGPVSALTGGNDPVTGLFFGASTHGRYTTVPSRSSPRHLKDGSSVSHVNDANAVMNMNINPNTVKRFQRYEIAMLLDIGWNVYNWNGTSGNWKDGVTTLANSRWLVDQGITMNETFSQTYNIHATPAAAPVLPPYAQKTSNIILNFGGSGAAYTSTNDLGTSASRG